MTTKEETDSIPAGYSYNTPEQKAKLEEAVQAVMSKLTSSGSDIGAVACVFAMPDGTVTAAIAGDATKPKALVSLITMGADVLRITLERMHAGKGETKIVQMTEEKA